MLTLLSVSFPPSSTRRLGWNYQPPIWHLCHRWYALLHDGVTKPPNKDLEDATLPALPYPPNEHCLCCHEPPYCQSSLPCDGKAATTYLWQYQSIVPNIGHSLGNLGRLEPISGSHWGNSEKHHWFYLLFELSLVNFGFDEFYTFMW